MRITDSRSVISIKSLGKWLSQDRPDRRREDASSNTEPMSSTAIALCSQPSVDEGPGQICGYSGFAASNIAGVTKNGLETFHRGHPKEPKKNRPYRISHRQWRAAEARAATVRIVHGEARS